MITLKFIDEKKDSIRTRIVILTNYDTKFKSLNQSKELSCVTFLLNCLPYAREKTAVGLFLYSLFCLWSIREGSFFQKDGLFS